MVSGSSEGVTSLIERRWIFSVLLVLPMIAVYIVHFGVVPKGQHATGFLQYDQFYYMANAREHFDSGHFNLFYGLPFSRFEQTPRIYFQPMSVVLGSLFHFTGWQPGYIYAILGLFAAIVCIRIAIGLYDEFVGLKSYGSVIGLVFFIWGGGLLAASGIVYTLLADPVNAGGAWYSFENIFRFDPFDGYWFLNFGRNFFYSTEALYHLLFLSVVLLIFKKRYLFACGMLGLMSVSHPFTGLQLILIVVSWGVYERFVVRHRLPNFRAPDLWRITI